jgi:hypothetical protein
LRLLAPWRRLPLIGSINYLCEFDLDLVELFANVTSFPLILQAFGRESLLKYFTAEGQNSQLH